MADLPSSIGRYEVVSRLGQGGMGSLFLAKDPKIGRLLAIKLVRQEFDSPDARTRFAREAQAAGTLRHTNIVTIFDVDEHEGLPFIAMEYIDGQTLAEIVRRKAPIEITVRLQWIEDLCAGLAYAHRQGVIHRDIKPANLMVDTEGTLKILDFGLARRDTSTFTQTQTLIGTPNYMSPEQIKGGEIDTRSDIFSVGSVLYEILAYQPAFPGSVHHAMHKIINEQPPPIEHIVQGLDPRVAAVIHRALEKEVARRYPDLSMMRTDIGAARLPPAADQPSETIRVGPRNRRISTTQSTRFSTDALQKRRVEQIEKKIEEAKAKFEAGQIEKARAACEEALFIDPQFPVAVRLMSQITAEVEKRQVAIWLSDARMALAKGQLDVATARANEALAVAPTSQDVILLLDAIETASREHARVRQIQDGLKRAKTQFSDGAFESVIRMAAEVLSLDPGNQSAAELQARALENLETLRVQAERDQQAQELLTEARALVKNGERGTAIEKLAAFPHHHDSVIALLASLREEVARAEAALAEALRVATASLAAAPPPAPPVPTPVPTPVPSPMPVVAVPTPMPLPPPPKPVEPAPVAPIVVEAPTLRRPPPAVLPAAERSGPSLRTILVAAATIIAAVSVAAVMMLGGEPSSGPGSAEKTPPPRPPVRPVDPTPGTREPVKESRPTNDAIKAQNDDDSAQAHQMVLKGQLKEATDIMEVIRKRDPNYEGLKDLQDAITLARKYELEEAAKKKKPGN